MTQTLTLCLGPSSELTLAVHSFTHVQGQDG